MRGQSINGKAGFLVFTPINKIIEILVGVGKPLRFASISLEQALYLGFGHAEGILPPIQLELANSLVQPYQDGIAAKRITTGFHFVPTGLQRFTITFIEFLRCFADARARYDI